MITRQSECVENEVVACPVCGDEFVHFGGIRIDHLIDGETGVEITHNTIKEFRHEKTNRGTRVTFRFWAECEHSWHTTMTFHKGHIIVKNIIQGELARPDGDIDTWRD